MFATRHMTEASIGIHAIFDDEKKCPGKDIVYAQGKATGWVEDGT
jgi:hypothetical protein